MIKKLPTEGCKSVEVKRRKALKFIDSGECDHEGKMTIFGQLF